MPGAQVSDQLCGSESRQAEFSCDFYYPLVSTVPIAAQIANEIATLFKSVFFNRIGQKRSIGQETAIQYRFLGAGGSCAKSRRCDLTSANAEECERVENDHRMPREQCTQDCTYDGNSDSPVEEGRNRRGSVDKNQSAEKPNPKSGK